MRCRRRTCVHIRRAAADLHLWRSTVQPRCLRENSLRLRGGAPAAPPRLRWCFYKRVYFIHGETRPTMLALRIVRANGRFGLAMSLGALARPLLGEWCAPRGGGCFAPAREEPPIRRSGVHPSGACPAFLWEGAGWPAHGRLSIERCKRSTGRTTRAGAAAVTHKPMRPRRRRTEQMEARYHA